MDLKEKVRVMHCAGVEGPSLYINNFRVCGPKPWGGGKVVKEWKDAEKGYILRALGDEYLTACNAHEELVEALKEMLRMCTMSGDDSPHRAKAIAALKKARVR